MIVADLFLEQCRPWEFITRRHVEKVWDAASRFVKLVVAHTADESTSREIPIGQSMVRRFRQVAQKRRVLT